MNNIEVRPEFLRAGKNDFFRKLNKEVQETVLKDKKLQYKNIYKAIFLLLLFLCCYCSILLFGSHTFLLFTFYILMGFSMILLFVNSFHDASHGALFFTKKQNRYFCYIVDFK